MATRLTLLSHAPTAATSASAFPADEPLDDRGRAWADAARGRFRPPTRLLLSPARACLETAAALGLTAESDPQPGWELRDWEPRDREPRDREPRDREPRDREPRDRELRDWELGRWRGHPLDRIAADEPEALQAWLTDPDAAPHGGEPLTALLTRVGRWLDLVPADGHTLAITPPAVIRAAVVGTLSGAAGGFWRIDIAPLTATVLHGRPGHWTLRSTGLPLVPRD